MATQTRRPYLVANDSSFGDSNWSTTANADQDHPSDDQYAQVVVGVVIPNSQYLKALYDFDIPVGSTINSITYNPELKSNGTVRDIRVRVVIGGVIGTNDYSDVSDWPSTDTTRSYDLTAESPTVAEINATDFGVAHALTRISGSAPNSFVDDMPITIDYTPSAADTLIPRHWVRRNYAGLDDF